MKPAISLTGHQLKLIAITAMLIDHIAWAFVDTQSVLGQLLHVIGRITAPTMCFFIAQGYIHTRSFPRYLGRMGIFALISHIPYVLFSVGKVTFLPFSVMYTLGLGLLAVYSYDRIKNETRRWLAVLGLAFLSIYGDWGFLGVLFCVVFYIHRDSFRDQCVSIATFTMVTTASQIASYLGLGYTLKDALGNSLFQLGILLSLPLIYLYNGERGGTSRSRWLFYIFYPTHLFILGILRWM